MSKSRSELAAAFSFFANGQFAFGGAADNITASVIDLPRTSATFFASLEKVTSMISSGSEEYNSFGCGLAGSIE
jgi:hypothetical protein